MNIQQKESMLPHIFALGSASLKAKASNSVPIPAAAAGKVLMSTEKNSYCVKLNHDKLKRL